VSKFATIPETQYVHTMTAEGNMAYQDVGVYTYIYTCKYATGISDIVLQWQLIYRTDMTQLLTEVCAVSDQI